MLKHLRAIKGKTATAPAAATERMRRSLKIDKCRGLGCTDTQREIERYREKREREREREREGERVEEVKSLTQQTRVD